MYNNTSSDWEDENNSMDKWIDTIHCLNKVIEGFVPPNVSNEEYDKLQAASATQQILCRKITLFCVIRIY